MGRILMREPKRVLREMTTSDGTRLRVVAYRIPEPGYQSNGCGARTSLDAHPDDLLEGMFAACMENPHFATILEALVPGLPVDIADDQRLGIGIEATAGNLLSVLLIGAQQDGLAPLLIRATEVRDAASAERFLAGWRSAEERALMSAAAERLLAIRDAVADRELATIFRRWGVAPKPLERKDKSGASIKDDVSTARQQLRRIIETSSRIGGG